MRVAVIHDWLTVYGGAERVLEQMLKLYPDADLYSVVEFLGPGERAFIKNKSVKTTFIQKMPLAKHKYRHYLPLMPLAVEQIDLSDYELVLSSSHAVAKGVLTGPEQLHLCLCYTPMRYAWNLQHQYLKETGLDRGLKSLLARSMLHKMRIWDLRTANGVDGFIAISKYIAGRIWKVYRRKAVVIYPPVDTEHYIPGLEKEDYYLAVSRMVPYKRMELIAETFARLPDKKLLMIGDGPEFKKVQAIAGKNVTLLGYQPDEALLNYMQQARAFIFAAEEDFGIVPLEAQACGVPVIAYGHGGALETICGLETDEPTGIFFEEQTAEALAEAVRLFENEQTHFSAEACRKNALRFAQQRFRTELQDYIDREIESRIV